MAYRKNKRRFDPRYFMNERMEEPSGPIGQAEEEEDYGDPAEEDGDTLEEMIPGDPGAGGRRQPAEREEEFYSEEEFPAGMSDLPPADEEWISLQDRIRKWARNNLVPGKRKYMDEG